MLINKYLKEQYLFLNEILITFMFLVSRYFTPFAATNIILGNYRDLNVASF